MIANARNVNKSRQESDSEEENEKRKYIREKGKENNCLKHKIFNFKEAVKVKKR
jgi:hypothetical protein